MKLGDFGFSFFMNFSLPPFMFVCRFIYRARILVRVCLKDAGIMALDWDGKKRFCS